MHGPLSVMEIDSVMDVIYWLFLLPRQKGIQDGIHVAVSLHLLQVGASWAISLSTLCSWLLSPWRNGQEGKDLLVFYSSKWFIVDLGEYLGTVYL